jgi:hypothetical protein
MNGDNKDEAKKMKWWQFVLMYPTLGISLAGSVPTVVGLYDSHHIGVPFRDTAAAKQQFELWQANPGCTVTAKTKSVTTKVNAQVSVTVCPSGDLLVAFQQPNSPQILRWIGVKSLLDQSSPIAGLLLGEAMAREKILIAQADSVLCQRLVDGRVHRRVRDAKGNCFDEVINPYTGVVEKRVPASSCDSNC